jgi:hypothetical protein
MKLKTLIATVVVLALISVAVYVARRPGPPASKDPRVGQTLIDRSTVEKAAKLKISDQGKNVTLVRQADGTWTDASYYDLPADFSKLSTFVNNLTDAKLDRLVTSNPERIGRLEFKDTKIELLDNSDKPVWGVTLGKNAETGGGRFVRFGDEQKAYLATLNAWLDTDPKNWANAELLDVKPDDVAKVEVGFAASAEGDKGAAAAPITLSRAKKDDPWTADKTPANQKVKADRVSSLLSSLGSLRFNETTEPNDTNAQVAKAHERVFKLTTFDNKTYTIALGRKPEEKKLKAPTASTDGKTGPAALGTMSDLAKKDTEKKDGEKKPEENKPVAPEFETIPAGPVFASISSSDAAAPINAEMQKRAFEVADYVYTGLPQKPEELFEPAPPPPPKPEEKKPETTAAPKSEPPKPEPAKK